MSKFEIAQIEAILFLSNDGERVASKYYKLHNNNLKNDNDMKHSFENELINQLNLTRDNGDNIGCIMIDGRSIVYQFSNDIYIVIVSNNNQNELIMSELLSTLYDCLLHITHDNVNKQGICDKMASIFLLLDDIVDRGIIMELDSNIIIKRLKRNESTTSESLPFNQAIYNVRNNVIRTLLNT